MLLFNEKSLNELELTCIAKYEFLPFFQRRNLHAPEEQLMLCTNLPKLFFAEAKIMMDKHFKQWICPKNLQLLLASEPKVSIAFCFWLEGKNIEDEVITCVFNNKTINLPAFISFCTNNIDPNDIKNYYFCTSNADDIKKVAEGKDWHANEEVSELKMHMLATYIPLIAHAQSIEAAVKDMAACLAIGRDELTVSAIATLRSAFCTMTKEHVDYDADFLNRKRTNEDANACYPGKIFNKNILNSVRSFFPDPIDENEYDY